MHSTCNRRVSNETPLHMSILIHTYIHIKLLKDGLYKYITLNCSNMVNSCHIYHNSISSALNYLLKLTIKTYKTPLGGMSQACS